MLIFTELTFKLCLIWQLPVHYWDKSNHNHRDAHFPQAPNDDAIALQSACPTSAGAKFHPEEKCWGVIVVRGLCCSDNTAVRLVMAVDLSYDPKVSVFDEYLTNRRLE